MVGLRIAPGMSVGCVGLFVGGFGLGQIITSVNILAGRRFTEHRGSALAMLNFSFSLGAMLSALLAAWLLPRFALRGLLEGFAGLFLLGGVGLLVQMRGDGSSAEEFQEAAVDGAPRIGLSGRVYLYFAGLLVLYGGLETCLSGWLTTFALRYGDKTLAVSEYTTLLLWMSLTCGAGGGFGGDAARGREDGAAVGIGIGGGVYGGSGDGAFGGDDCGVRGAAGVEPGAVLSGDVGVVDGGAADGAAGGDCAGGVGAGGGGAAVDDGCGVDADGIVAGGAGVALRCGAWRCWG